MTQQHWTKRLEDALALTIKDDSIRNIGTYLFGPIIAAERIAQGHTDKETLSAVAAGVIGLTVGLPSSPAWARWNHFINPIVIVAMQSLLASPAYATGAMDQAEIAKGYDEGALNTRALLVELAVALKTAELGGAMVPANDVRDIRARFMGILV